MLPCRRVEAESRGAARGRGKAGSVCRRDGEGLACGSSALITAAALVCHGQLAAQGRHKSACEHSSSPPNPSESLGAGKAAWPARNGPGTQGSAGDTGLCSPHACSVAGPCFWKVPVAVGPTEGRMWASALACSRVQQHPGRASPLYHLMCAAAETPPLTCADSTGTEQAGSVSVPGEGMVGDWCGSPCVTRNHAMLVQTTGRWVQSSAQSAGLIQWVLAQHPLHHAGPVSVWRGESVLEEGDGKTFLSIPRAAGTCRSNSASSCPPVLSFPWLSTLTFPSASRLSPQLPLLPAAGFGAGGRWGGATADEQPWPLPPAPLSSQPSPPQHSSSIY